MCKPKSVSEIVSDFLANDVLGHSQYSRFFVNFSLRT